MKGIDEYVHSLYANVGGKEAKELKQEMRSHLIEAVEELKAKGIKESEAISIALERFGDEKQIKSGLLTMFKSQKKFAKWLFRSAFIFLLIGFVVSISLYMKDNKYIETSDLMAHVVETFDTKGNFTPEDEQALKDMVDRNSRYFENISYFALVKNTEEQGKKTSEQLFVHGREGTGEFGENGLMKQGIAGEDTWHVEWEYETYDYLKYEPYYYVFFAISVVLFVLWGVVNFYHRRLKAFA
ncbi:permease prefix domain 1-containing protein [Peribacillus frigoritolerans]|uniref:permease prefix domain 1-containing protein n=1 Tax=Peribacillus frigoritolerans TaxID=450367 RepID=UPI0022261F40|nr:permease prefix domain 1-containing protein [Peribacillus frigoritolerans]UYY98269.1 permease prefix domain 1-containing protein [Peribacillus frigoritolerans]